MGDEPYTAVLPWVVFAVIDIVGVVKKHGWISVYRNGRRACFMRGTMEHGARGHRFMLRLIIPRR